jgi:hypothetical protein
MSPVNPQLDELFYQSTLAKTAYAIIVEYAILNSSINIDDDEDDDEEVFENLINDITDCGRYKLYEHDDLYDALHEDIFLHLDYLEQKHYSYYQEHLELHEILNPNELIKAIMKFIYIDYLQEINKV